MKKRPLMAFYKYDTPSTINVGPKSGLLDFKRISTLSEMFKLLSIKTEIFPYSCLLNSFSSSRLLPASDQRRLNVPAQPQDISLTVNTLPFFSIMFFAFSSMIISIFSAPPYTLTGYIVIILHMAGYCQPSAEILILT